MPIDFTEQTNEIIREQNEDFVCGLRDAISKNNVFEYFDSFSSKINLFTLLEVLEVMEDSEDLFVGIYDYIFKRSNDYQIYTFLLNLAKYDKVQIKIKKDLDYLYNKILEEKQPESAITFLKLAAEVNYGSAYIIPKIEKIIPIIHPSSIRAAIEGFKNDELFNKHLQENFYYYIKNSKIISTIYLIEQMSNIDLDYTNKFIRDNFNLIVERSSKGSLGSLIKYLLKNDMEELIKKNIRTVLKSANASEVVDIINTKKICENIYSDKSIIKDIQTSMGEYNKTRSHNAIGAIIKSEKIEYIDHIIKSLMEEENVDEFIPLGEGNWSNIVLKIGTKVLKIGWIRNNPNIKDHFRIIKPEFFEVIKENGEPILYIEIQKYLTQDGVTKELVKEFFDDLEKAGLIYTDPRTDDIEVNFGFLDEIEENNKAYSKTFKKNPIVLLDRDCVWDKNDPNIKYFSSF